MKLYASILLASMCAGTPALASGPDSFLCKQLTGAEAKAFDTGEWPNSGPLMLINGIAMGAYLGASGRKYSDLDKASANEPFKRLFIYCQNNPNEIAIDAATVSVKSSQENARPIAAVDAPTASEIARALSKKRTELEQEAWWDEHMAGKSMSLTGTVDEVEKGTFSGYWVRLDIGHDIRVRCGMSAKWKSVAANLRKGQKFTCQGKVDRTWIALFGIMFQMDAG
jgi:hypothetical protein